ncbi:toluene-4-monooxygenase system B family protein [Caballeronia sp. LZ029]|uniref:toluene-4-monooxygenase system B family protein n=1 Tax=Caballeronia sp. LZ029 TaxID=3038564 RepID=UPI00285A24BA|nr:toluene-4-monooxygenase system B family protein [Caballeronia sp. LZ029]MDR5749044.1 toluene-4-monooxygenase system B family protein [Caballeronia sp. LZ029]
MSNFALVCNYEGDYGMKVIMLDDDYSMEDVARIAKENIAGVFVPEPLPGTKLRVRRHGEEEFLPESMTISAAGFIQAETVDIVHVKS